MLAIYGHQCHFQWVLHVLLGPTPALKLERGSQAAVRRGRTHLSLHLMKESVRSGAVCIPKDDFGVGLGPPKLPRMVSPLRPQAAAECDDNLIRFCDEDWFGCLVVHTIQDACEFYILVLARVNEGMSKSRALLFLGKQHNSFSRTASIYELKVTRPDTFKRVSYGDGCVFHYERPSLHVLT